MTADEVRAVLVCVFRDQAEDAAARLGLTHTVILCAGEVARERGADIDECYEELVLNARTMTPDVVLRLPSALPPSLPPGLEPAEAGVGGAFALLLGYPAEFVRVQTVNPASGTMGVILPNGRVASRRIQSVAAWYVADEDPA